MNISLGCDIKYLISLGLFLPVSSDNYREVLLVRDPANLKSAPVKDLMLSLGPGVLLEHVLGGDLGFELPDKLLVSVVRHPGQIIRGLVILVSEN